jgi:hypothetical protein
MNPYMGIRTVIMRRESQKSQNHKKVLKEIKF